MDTCGKSTYVGTAGNLLVDTVRFASRAPPAPTERRPPLEISPIGLLPDAPLAPPRPNHLAGNATNRTSSSPGPSPRPPNPGQHSSRQHSGGNCYETTMPVDMSELLSLSLRNVVQNYIQTQKNFNYVLPKHICLQHSVQRFQISYIGCRKSAQNYLK